MRQYGVILLLALCAFGSNPSISSADDYLDLPAGVTHIALPPGDIKIEYTVKNGKPLLRTSVGKTAIVAQTVFFGDGKAARQCEALKNGIRWTSVKTGKGFRVDGEIISESGSTTWFMDGDYLTVDQLKPGALYLTSPSVFFKFDPERKSKK